MRLLKWYAITLAVGLVLLVALVYLAQYTRYASGNGLAGAFSWHHEAALYDVAEAIHAVALALLALTFIAGLASVLRDPLRGPYTLSPVVLVLTVATLGFTASLLSWYGVVSTNDVSGFYGVPVRELAIYLGSGVGLGAALFVITALRARRAS